MELAAAGSRNAAAGRRSDFARLDEPAAWIAAPDLLILAAMAGGGKRSASLAHGAPKGMRQAKRRNPLSRPGVQAGMANRYLNPAESGYVHLVNRGVFDNLALRSGGAMIQAIPGTDSELRSQGFTGIRRILVLTIDGQGTQDSVAHRQVVGGLFSVLGLASGPGPIATIRKH
jgi:hypothetical protein